MIKMSYRLPELPPEAFLKEEGGDDVDFYAPARLVTHIDEAAKRVPSTTARAEIEAPPLGSVNRVSPVAASEARKLPA